MMNSIFGPNKKTARMAGLMYLIIAVCGPIGMMYVPSVLVVPGDAAATADNIMASGSLFRLGLVSDTIVFLAEIVLVVLLYILFKQVSETLSLAAAFSRLAMAVVQGINLLNHFFVLLLLSGAGYLAAAFLVPGTIGELALALWLLIKGIKESRPAATGTGRPQ